METGQLRKIQIEATGGHRELTAVVQAVLTAVEKLRMDSSREAHSLMIRQATTVPSYIASPINLEGTIRVETEDDL